MRLGVFTAAASLAILFPSSKVLAEAGEAIGLYAAVQGTVTVGHIGTADPVPVRLHDDVFFKDLIETREASWTKALFEDDTLLTVGPESRVEVHEHIYDPNLDVRSTVLRLVKGTLRALVGRTFEGAGSRFEIHTSHAVAAARGTYFVVWVEPPTGGVAGASVIANIGKSGDVTFTARGLTVTVRPGTYSRALPGMPPTHPAEIATKVPPSFLQGITKTRSHERPKPEEPAYVLSLLGDDVLSHPLARSSSNHVVGTLDQSGEAPSQTKGSRTHVADGSTNPTNSTNSTKRVVSRLPVTAITPPSVLGTMHNSGGLALARRPVR